MDSSNNLLLRLHKWAWRQDENFQSEAFAHLLEHLRDSEPEVAADLLKKLTGGKLALPEGNVRSVSVTTQVTTDTGRPDLELSALGHLVYVEAKVNAAVDSAQLMRHRVELAARVAR